MTTTKMKRTDLRRRKNIRRTARQQLGTLVTRTKVVAGNRARTVGKVVRHPVRSAKRGVRAVGSGAKKVVRAADRAIHRAVRKKR